MKRLAKNSKGFTLIELMIVVAIIGILAAIAIPNFLRYQLKSKTAEAKTNIGAIKTSQEAFRAEWDGYLPCALKPTTKNDTKQQWSADAANDGFSEIGFAPTGDVYYNYQVAVGGGSAIANIAGSTLTGQSGSFAASAIGDLDKDGSDFGMFIFASSVDAGMQTTTGSVTTAATKAGVVQDVNPGKF